MAETFSNIPTKALGKPKPFSLRVSDDRLKVFKSSLSWSNISTDTWSSTQNDNQSSGLKRQWLVEAKEALLRFDWRQQEDRINSLPNFTLDLVDTKSGQATIHFLALFSANQAATPIMFMHGWPGSILEFLPMLELLQTKYTAETLPYHIIVPSLPGYGYSAIMDHDFTIGDAARILNKFMIQLGFGDGYIAQGGDVGGFIATILSAAYKECKGFHVNTITLRPDDDVRDVVLTEEESEVVKRMQAWRDEGSAYALQHATRPSTIRLVVSSNPLALLAWVGEKFQEWADPRKPLPLKVILASVSFYWYTSTFERSLYPYIGMEPMILEGVALPVPISKEKPMGYSLFPYEMMAIPKAWAVKIYKNLIFFKSHTKGGHFAALEVPELLLQDIEQFVLQVYTPDE